MKIYISADIEGVTGAAHWDETERGKKDYIWLSEQMTREVAAACKGAISAGADDIWIKDAHDSARNLILDKLPKFARLVRGWSGHPFVMMQELDRSFDAAIFIGYHSRCGSNTNPLAHTFSTSASKLIINGQPISEFMLNSLIASWVGVPVVMLSGDQGVCQEARKAIAGLRTVETNQGVGDSAICQHPVTAQRLIEEETRKSLESLGSIHPVKLPKRFEVSVEFKEHPKAYRAGFFPGVLQKDAHTVEFEREDYFEVLRVLNFIF